MNRKIIIEELPSSRSTLDRSAEQWALVRKIKCFFLLFLFTINKMKLLLLESSCVRKEFTELCDEGENLLYGCVYSKDYLTWLCSLKPP